MKANDFKNLTSVIEQFKKDHAGVKFTRTVEMYRLSTPNFTECICAEFWHSSDWVNFTHYTPSKEVDGIQYSEVVHKEGTYNLTELQKRKIKELFMSEYKYTLNIVMRRNTEIDTPEIFYYDDYNKLLCFSLSDGHNEACYNYMTKDCKLVNYSNPLADEVLLLQRFKNSYKNFNVSLVKKLSRN